MRVDGLRQRLIAGRIAEDVDSANRVCSGTGNKERLGGRETEDIICCGQAVGTLEDALKGDIWTLSSRPCT